MSSSRGVKRKNGNCELTGREKKKQKVNQARTISVQSSSVATGSGNGAVRGMRGLPSAIDVEKFAEARSFEIDAMEKAIKTASAVSTQRAWQALPRHLRRRAASHDVRRVPARLREKAKAEMDPIRKTLVSKNLPRAGRNKRVKKTDAFLKRQRDKHWLETHIWHAKRMKMENIWGYRLAIEPTGKAYRPSHRASIQGAIIHDASYLATIEMKGPQSTLIAILELLCDFQGPSPGAVRWVVGSRVFNTHLYKCGTYPLGLLGPVTVIWRAVYGPTTGSDVKDAQKGKESVIGAMKGVPGADTNRSRTLWLRIHPVIFDDVTKELQKATSQILALPRSSTDETAVEIADLRGQVNAFEIMGPKSSQILKGALLPVLDDDRADFKKFWSSLPDLQTPGSIARGTVVGFTVIDPRLKFPPKNAPIEFKEEAPQIFPSAELGRSDIWETDIRKTLSTPRYKKKDLDERRSKNLIPGVPLRPTRQDDRIPLLLVRRTLETPGAESQAIHGYTLLLPAGWSMAFWSSLTYTGSRIGGQRERQTQSFEAGVAYFPQDFPFTTAYEEWAKRKESEEKESWQRKPPAKRVSYSKLGVRSPWKADWDVVLGLKEAEPFLEPPAVLKRQKGKRVEERRVAEELVSTQRNGQINVDEDEDDATKMLVEEDIEIPDDSMLTEADKPGVRSWLFRGLDMKKIYAAIQGNPEVNLMAEINQLRRKRSLQPLGPTIELLKHALVNVQVIQIRDGVFQDMAMIYKLSDEEATRWEQTIEGGPISVNPLQLANKRPSNEDIIGYVTTGHYSLSRGKGFALGAIPLTRLLELQAQQARLHSDVDVEKHNLLVKIRNVSGQQCRAAHIKILECGN